MPEYVFKHPEKNEYVELFFKMNDEKKYSDENGVEWKRVFLPSELNSSGSVDPWNSKSFTEKTGQLKGNYGDILDLSSEMSAARAEKNGGVDPVKKKVYDNYAKKRGGARHPQELKEKTIDNKNIKIIL